MSLSTLRADPMNACMGAVYQTVPQSGAFTGTGNMVEGGSCRIAATSPAPGVHTLTASEAADGGDYFFPWVARSVGWVKVPKAAPDGTIVMTGGMNGCAFVVTADATHYYFYHDGDSRYLTPQMTTGAEVARAANKDYDPLGWGQKIFLRAGEEMRSRNETPQGPFFYAHYVIAVKAAGKFGLYATGLMSANGLQRLPIGLSPRITSF